MVTKNQLTNIRATTPSASYAVKSNSSSGNRGEIKAALVEERPTKPPGLPKFSRKANQNSEDDLLDQRVLDKNTAPAICQQMLMDGFVQSYVDFYHLTHRHDDRHSNNSGLALAEVAATTQQQHQHHTDATKSASQTSSNSIVLVNITTEDLIYIRDNLVQAELARRQGDTSNVYTAYNKLADHYVTRKDWKTGFFFHEKCLEVAQLTNDLRAEMSANHSLGVINQLMLNYDRARIHHEKHEVLATSVDIFEEIARANAELYKVYVYLAEKCEAEGQVDAALEMFRKCDEAAKKSWDKGAEAEANGRIGNLYLNRGQLQESIPYLRHQSQLAADLGNPESRCRACTALALAYDLLGQPEKALNELQLVHTISEQSGDAYLQAQACRALGTLYSKVGRLDAAVDILQRHFNLLKTLLFRPANAAGEKKAFVVEDSSKKISSTDLDLARSYIGISRGNQMLGSYVVCLQFDFGALLDWKLNRSEMAKLSNQTSVHEAQPPPSTALADIEGAGNVTAKEPSTIISEGGTEALVAAFPVHNTA